MIRCTSCKLGGLSFQPAQLGITAGILLIAWLMQDLPKLHRWFGAPFIRIGIIGVIAAVPFLMVMKMGDMGSALVWIPVPIVALIVGGIPFRYLTCMAFLGAGVLPLLYFVALPLVSKRGPERIDVWLRMMQGREVDISGDAYAPHYVSMAVGKAGWKGVGWKATVERGSLHEKGFIPRTTAHNDYIFGVIAEETGLPGQPVAAHGLRAVADPRAVHRVLQPGCVRTVAGVSRGRAVFRAHLREHRHVRADHADHGNSAAAVSYSGTFVVICMFLLGLVQSVWIHRNRKPELQVTKAEA